MKSRQGGIGARLANPARHVVYRCTRPTCQESRSHTKEHTTAVTLSVVPAARARLTTSAAAKVDLRLRTSNPGIDRWFEFEIGRRRSRTISVACRSDKTSHTPSLAIRMKRSSGVSLNVLTSGSAEMTPTSLNFRSPIDLEQARRQANDGWSTLQQPLKTSFPPASSIILRSLGNSGLWSVDNLMQSFSRPNTARESPTLPMTKSLPAKTATHAVVPSIHPPGVRPLPP
mmetsp:Transcript_18432/g.35475  ORF Transcript_18432/g.35475 Transcript_18432/m.35475 type:complete len:229 (-) Transcript_18432:78-764(-)